MPLPRHLRTAFTVCFWVYGLFLLIATHAPADEVQFIVQAADYGLLDPDKLLHMAAYGVLGLLGLHNLGAKVLAASPLHALHLLHAVLGDRLVNVEPRVLRAVPTRQLRRTPAPSRSARRSQSPAPC